MEGHVIKNEFYRLLEFDKCLRSIKKIWWSRVIMNEGLCQLTQQKPIDKELKK